MENFSTHYSLKGVECSEGGIGAKEDDLLLLCDCFEPVAEIRTQLVSHLVFTLAGRQVLESLCLVLSPL